MSWVNSIEGDLIATPENRGRSRITVMVVFVVGLMVGAALFQAVVIMTSPAKKQLSLDEQYNESIDRSMTEGLSEFVLKKNSTVLIHSVSSTATYLDLAGAAS